jgi:hypothetical protein
MGTKLTLFRSTKEPDIFGFTSDPSGNNLPGQFGPWLKAGAGSLAQTYAGDSLEGLALSDPVIRAVQHEGYYLARSGIAVTLGQEPG